MAFWALIEVGVEFESSLPGLEGPSLLEVVILAQRLTAIGTPRHPITTSISVKKNDIP